MYDWQRVLRTAQTYFPALVDAKYRAQHAGRALLRRPFERDFDVLAHFRPEATADFLDIGANRGQAVQAIRFHNVDNPITCFEPSTRAFDQLVRYTRNVEHVALRAVGLGAEKAELALYTPVYRGYVFDGLASVVRSEAAEWLADRILFFDERHLEVLEDVVRIETLDEQDARPAFVKIDVQGGELAVLRGGVETIRRSRPVILLEAPEDDREVAFLRDLDYDAYRFDGRALRRGLGGTVNAFFIPPERVAQVALPVLDE